ncbi:hypothetical protein ID866_7620 [Astraeus odoratus]|nr:hypothetical protein ID866_7620 [Astraeus odoratus]
MSCSPTPSSPVPFQMSSVAASTAASSPASEDQVADSSQGVSRHASEVPAIDEEEQEFRERFARLERLLEKSFTYSQLLGEQMDKEKRTSALRAAMAVSTTSAKPKSTNASARKRGATQPTRKRARVEDEPDRKEEVTDAPATIGGPKLKPDSRANDAPAPRPKFLQPSLVTGAQLKDYQLDGVEWMVSLDKNGVSGILADEMGLGKTLQTIAFNAHLRELGHYRPFLIVCPLSVIHNWIEEFRRFAPSIPVSMYHGSPAERAELRHTVMRQPDDGSEATARPFESVMVKEEPVQPRKKGRKSPKAKAQPTRKSTRTTRKRKAEFEEEEDEEIEESESDEENIPRTRKNTIKSNTSTAALSPQTRATFPVVVTTYEMIIRDRPYLSKYNWGYIVVDEGHRLKNLNCRLIQEIKKYPSAGRMILTGTPLHVCNLMFKYLNNLAELWSLLNFILPDIFDDLDTFQEWFNLGTLQSRLSSSQSTQLIHTLHGILKPFLLRRLKVDVLGQTLPPKKEYVIYAPLSVRQREIYDAVVEGSLRSFLLARGGDTTTAKKAEINVDAPRKLRNNRKSRVKVDVLDGDDDEYFEMLENGDVEHVSRKTLMYIVHKVKGINNLRLQNTVMQLRKACSHPLLFDAGMTEAELYSAPATAEDLVDNSGKMMVLERLLDELFARGHKVLLFSQFTTMLDIIESWATELKGWNICRIDGRTDPLERREQMNIFQQGGDRPDAPRLFLLSTRAGGLGINLTAADTVIFYDQDWNPQMDVQAQDRAHRIGQTKPVLILRLVTAHTIEERIMHRASEKRKLEALVIAKGGCGGKFKMPGQAGRTKAEALGEMTAALLKLESEQIEVVPATREGKKGVLSDEDLKMLLDRSEGVFSGRGKGWSSAGGVGSVAHSDATTRKVVDRDGPAGPGPTAAGKRAAFAVYEAPVHEANEWVAKIMGEDIAE